MMLGGTWLKLRILGLALVVGLALAECPDGTSDRKYNATVFFETVSYWMASYQGHAFSPDGMSILYTSDKNGVQNAYAQPIAGGEPEALTTSTTDAIYAFSFFPADNRILYDTDEGGNELFHIYVREENGTVRDLTPGENLRAEFGGWNENGTAFWLQTNERDERYFDIYQYSTNDNYNRTMVYQNDPGLSVYAGSPNGQWIALVKVRNAADSDIYLVDLQSENQTAVLITEHEGNVEHGVHAFTRDSAKLIYSTNEFGEFHQAWTYDLATEEKAALIEADWDVDFVILSPSGRYRVSGVNADAQTNITILDTEIGEELGMPELPAGDLGQVRFSADEDTVAFLISSDTSPSNVFVVSLESKDLVRLTTALNPEICQEDLVDGEVIRYQSFDDLEIPSILYMPNGASAEMKVPALVSSLPSVVPSCYDLLLKPSILFLNKVWVHGGPGGQSRKGYTATIQHLVNQGYAILAANNRGSSGYGKTFYHMDDKRHGEVDLQDIVYGKTYLEGLDWIDPDRIGIMGGSYGGYMVMAALAFEPDVFDVGINIFGVTNWLRTLESIPPYWEAEREALYDELGDPATDEERLRRISPLFHADQINKPVLVVQGANDPRVLQVESDEIVEALKNNSVPVEYLLFEEEGHGFLKRSNRIEADEAYVSFLKKYLKNLEDTDPPSSVDETYPPPSMDSGSKIVSFSSLLIWGSLAMLNAAQRLISH